MPNNEYHLQKWSFDPKLSNLVHECTSWNFHVKSWIKVFQSKINLVSRVLMKNASASQNGFVDVMRSLMEKKNFNFGEICFNSKWKVEFWNIEMFLTWKFWFLNENLRKWMFDPLLVIKILFVFSHLDSSLIPQRKMVQMRIKESKYGVYIHA